MKRWSAGVPPAFGNSVVAASHAALLVACGLSICMFLFCASPAVAVDLIIAARDVEEDWNLTQAFQNKDGWTGADDAYSYPVGDHKALWIFADTFVGKIRNNKRINPVMIHNSVALQRFSNSWPRLRFYYPSHDGKPEDVFPPLEKGTYYWPGAGTMLNGKLYMFLKKIRPTESGPPEFRFDWFADDLIQIDNPSDLPSKWRTKTVSIPTETRNVLMGVACTEDEDYVYSYLDLEGKKVGLNLHPLGLARIRKSELAKLNMGAWQFYCERKLPDVPVAESCGAPGIWLDKPDLPRVLFWDAAPEMTVTRCQSDYVAVYMSPLSADIKIRLAHSPVGPWTDAIAPYTCPESNIRVNGKSVMVYSAKAHPELSKALNDLVITYCVNAGDIKEHLVRADLYQPRAISVKLVTELKTPIEISH